jgi:hypothetical protein
MSRKARVGKIGRFKSNGNCPFDLLPTAPTHSGVWHHMGSRPFEFCTHIYKKAGMSQNERVGKIVGKKSSGPVANPSRPACLAPPDRKLNAPLNVMFGLIPLQLPTKFTGRLSLNLSLNLLGKGLHNMYKQDPSLSCTTTFLIGK